VGWQVGAVQTNAANNARFLLIDPMLVVGTNNANHLPYVQTSTGASNAPTSPRFIFLSSLGPPLPNALISGAHAMIDFIPLWTNLEGALPATATWSSWNGKGSDLLVQRLDLSSSFCQLALINRDATNPFFSIDNSSLTALTTTQQMSGYFLTSTLYQLYQVNTNLQAAQVLLRDCSYAFQAGLWRMDLGSAAYSLGSASGSGYTNLQPLPLQFYTNAQNPSAQNGVLPAKVYNDMTNWMGLYIQYAASGFNKSAAIHAQIQTAATTLTNDTKYLIH
jgi:hypothetical protein